MTQAATNNPLASTVFHAVVWTQRALSIALPDAKPLIQTMSDRAATAQPEETSSRAGASLVSLTDRAVPHVLVAASSLASAQPLSSNLAPWLSFHLDTDPDELRRAGLNYCVDTVRRGNELLKRRLGSDVLEAGRLGVVASPEASDEAKECFKELRETESSYVQWDEYFIDESRRYYGPNLCQLAREALSARGVFPGADGHVLWICSAGADEDFLHRRSLDLAIALEPYYYPPGCCINIGAHHLSEDVKRSSPRHEGADPVIDLAGDSGGANSAATFAGLSLLRPVTLHHRSQVLLDRKKFYHAIGGHRTVARKNLDDGIAQFHALTEQRLPWSKEACKSNDAAFQQLFDDGCVFDHKSGAISFDAFDWMGDRVLSGLNSPWSDVIEYFNDTRETPWQTDRPNYRRILATNTQVILRGEDYYANLENIAPLKRIRTVLANTHDALAKLRQDRPVATIDEWKLCLGVLDQVRNGALQLTWFENQLSHIDSFRSHVAEPFSQSILAFLDTATEAYYAELAGRSEPARRAQLHNEWRPLETAVRTVLDSIDGKLKDWKRDQTKTHLLTTKLVRRWREADHPGENTLVALCALDWLASQADPYSLRELPPAVGVGWGGIELPIVYRQIARLKGLALPKIFAAHYSKYAKSGNRAPRLQPLSPSADVESLRDARILLFDDNSLSGRTLQTVIEHLYLKYKAKVSAIFVTRLSGERRYDQMRMSGSGLLDPELVGSHVLGHLGETPFARSWSREVYQNPIGVFSLARRRILELLFSNSSADRFDREGF